MKSSGRKGAADLGKAACAAVRIRAPNAELFEVRLARISAGTEGKGCVCVVEAGFPQGGKISGGVHGTYCTLNAARQLEKNGGRMS